MNGALRVFSLMAGLASVALWGLSRTRSPAVSHRRNPIRAVDPEIAARPLIPSSRCSSVSALTRDEAEELVRWLRSTGRTHTETFYVPEEGFTVFFF